MFIFYLKQLNRGMVFDEIQLVLKGYFWAVLVGTNLIPAVIRMENLHLLHWWLTV